ncbi:porin family protein [Cyclobacterium jeungdonense]|uniref:Porin family protein n=1 Tax=Cyclobacterium jeungdonense TaxID=708087 RepID=A0ABT8CB04_9BACT|nr:porin family protein [Cyclobacterium jeungdonense]MDN3688983.1 porin family protein [Cyclobacterium jeungdonense]
MKIIISTLFAILLISGTSFAQHVNFGIKGGVNSYTIKGDNTAGFDSKTSFHIGLIGHIHMANQFALQPELVYSVQGAQNGVAGQDVELDLNYVNVPLLFQYMFDNGFRLQAGPQLGFLASAKSGVNDNKTDVTDNFESMDLGLGVGASYVNPATNFGVDVRYNMGLSNINKTGNANYYNRGFQAGVFYLFKH